MSTEGEIQKQLDRINEYAQSYKISQIVGVSIYNRGQYLVKLTKDLSPTKIEDNLSNFASLLENLEDELTSVKTLPKYIAEELKAQLQKIEGMKDQLTSEINTKITGITSRLNQIQISN